MFEAIKGILSSKKGLATLAGVIVFLLSLADIIVGPEQILPVLGLIAFFVLGQGLADVGKEAKKLEVAAVEKLADSEDPT